MRLGSTEIGQGHKPFVVAELSGNHNQSLERGLALMEAAARAGADAVKLQTYTADTITMDHDGPGFVVEGGLWHGRSLHGLYREAHTPWSWHEALFARGAELGVSVFSSPFDESAVDFLESLGCPAYKIASFELVHLPLIAKAASTAKPLIMSTGMATAEEIGEAVAAARGAGCKDLVLLHCVSAYPAPPQESNLRTMSDLATRFGVPVGLSDHTMGTAVAVAAAALGACLIEKHVTLARADGGPDAAFSLEPQELADLCRDTRVAWSAIGSASYGPKGSDKANAAYRRSLYVVEDIRAGEKLTARNVRCIRPGYGLPPKHLPQVLGRRAAKAVQRGTPLAWDLVD